MENFIVTRLSDSIKNTQYMNEMLFYYIIPFKEWNVYKSINYVTTFILYMFPIQIEKKVLSKKNRINQTFVKV